MVGHSKPLLPDSVDTEAPPQAAFSERSPLPPDVKLPPVARFSPPVDEKLATKA